MNYELNNVTLLDESKNIFFAGKIRRNLAAMQKVIAKRDAQLKRLSLQVTLIILGTYFVAMLPFMDKYLQNNGFMLNLLLFLLVPFSLVSVANVVVRVLVRREYNRGIQQDVPDMELLDNTFHVEMFLKEITRGTVSLTKITDTQIEFDVTSEGKTQHRMMDVLSKVNWNAEKTVIHVCGDHIVFDLCGNEQGGCLCE